MFYRLLRSVRNIIWAVTVAYMLGIHNVYRQEDKTPDDIVITTEENAIQEDRAAEE